MLRIIAVAATAAALLAAPLAATAQTAATNTTGSKPAAASAKKPVSAGRAAMLDRQRKCGAEWKEAKAANKVEKGQTWPKFWSACNKRLKS